MYARVGERFKTSGVFTPKHPRKIGAVSRREQTGKSHVQHDDPASPSENRIWIFD
jgi:hypothetical protein